MDSVSILTKRSLSEYIIPRQDDPRYLQILQKAIVCLSLPWMASSSYLFFFSIAPLVGTTLLISGGVTLVTVTAFSALALRTKDWEECLLNQQKENIRQQKEVDQQAREIQGQRDRIKDLELELESLKKDSAKKLKAMEKSCAKRILAVSDDLAFMEVRQKRRMFELENTDCIVRIQTNANEHIDIPAHLAVLRTVPFFDEAFSFLNTSRKQTVFEIEGCDELTMQQFLRYVYGYPLLKDQEIDLESLFQLSKYLRYPLLPREIILIELDRGRLSEEMVLHFIDEGIEFIRPQEHQAYNRFMERALHRGTEENILRIVKEEMRVNKGKEISLFSLNYYAVHLLHRKLYYLSMEYLRASADRGDAWAQACLAWLLNLKGKEIEAFNYARASAQQSNPYGKFVCTYRLLEQSTIRLYGYFMVEAAKEGNAYAQYIFAENIERGSDDPAFAFEWYLKSAEQGCYRALLKVAECYRTGYGVPIHLQLAEEYRVRAEKAAQVLQEGCGKLFDPFFSFIDEIPWEPPRTLLSPDLKVAHYWPMAPLNNRPRDAERDFRSSIIPQSNDPRYLKIIKRALLGIAIPIMARGAFFLNVTPLTSLALMIAGAVALLFLSLYSRNALLRESVAAISRENANRSATLSKQADESFQQQKRIEDLGLEIISIVEDVPEQLMIMNQRCYLRVEPMYDQLDCMRKAYQTTKAPLLASPDCVFQIPKSEEALKKAADEALDDSNPTLYINIPAYRAFLQTIQFNENAFTRGVNDQGQTIFEIPGYDAQTIQLFVHYVNGYPLSTDVNLEPLFKLAQDLNFQSLQKQILVICLSQDRLTKQMFLSLMKEDWTFNTPEEHVIYANFMHRNFIFGMEKEFLDIIIQECTKKENCEDELAPFSMNCFATYLYRHGIEAFGHLWKEKEELIGRLFFYLKSSADRGDSWAQAHLAYFTLFFIPKKIGLDYAEASAKQNDPYGKYGLALCEKNLRWKGMYLFMEAAEGGYAEASYTIAMLLLPSPVDASLFFPVDTSLSFNLYLKAADQGNGSASSEVAECYEKGLGVPIDRHLAKKYYEQAIKLWNGRIGGVPASQGLERLQKAHPELFVEPQDDQIVVIEDEEEA